MIPPHHTTPHHTTPYHTIPIPTPNPTPSPQQTSDAKWVKDRTHESYAKTYAIVFPHDEALAGRGARTSALHSELEAAGCVHQARHGFERPGWFEKGAGGGEGEGGGEGGGEGEGGARGGSQVPLPYDYYGAYADEGGWRLGAEDKHPASIPSHEEGAHLYHSLIDNECTFGWPSSLDAVAEECRAAREGVAIFDQSYFGKFLLSGPDAKVRALPCPRVCSALLCSALFCSVLFCCLLLSPRLLDRIHLQPTQTHSNPPKPTQTHSNPLHSNPTHSNPLHSNPFQPQARRRHPLLCRRDGRRGRQGHVHHDVQRERRGGG